MEEEKNIVVQRFDGGGGGGGGQKTYFCSVITWQARASRFPCFANLPPGEAPHEVRRVLRVQRPISSSQEREKNRRILNERRDKMQAY